MDPRMDGDPRARVCHRIMDSGLSMEVPEHYPPTGGGRGIRTPGPFGPRLFKSLAIVRSAIPPMGQGSAEGPLPG
jgi:hypothetical protein